MSVGKKHARDAFPQVKTEEEAMAELKEQAEAAGNPDMIAMDTYFSIKGIRDVPTMAAMAAFTKVKKATVETWNSIFSTF